MGHVTQLYLHNPCHLVVETRGEGDNDAADRLSQRDRRPSQALRFYLDLDRFLRVSGTTVAKSSKPGAILRFDLSKVSCKTGNDSSDRSAVNDS